MKLSELLNNVMIAAGIPGDDENLKKLLGNPALNQDDIPANWESASNNIMTVDTAKYHPAVKSHFYGAALNPVETELQKLMEAYEFGDEDKAEFTGIKSTYQKIPLLKEKIDALMTKKASANTGDSKKYADQISQLNAEIVRIKQDAQSKVQEVENKRVNELKELHIDGMLNGYNYIKSLSKDVAKVSAKTLMNQYLDSKGAKVKIENGKLALVNAQDEALPYIENNQPVEFKTLLDRIVADNRMLDLGQNTATAPQGQQATTPGSTNAGTQFLQEQLAAIRANAQTKI